MLVLFAEAYGFPSRRIVSWLLVSKLTAANIRVTKVAPWPYPASRRKWSSWAGSTQKCTTPTRTRKKRRSKIGLEPMRKQSTINDAPIELCPDANSNDQRVLSACLLH